MTDRQYPNHILDDFEVKGKIDFFKTALPISIESYADALRFETKIQGKISCPRRWWHDWVTIHDPTTSDLQYLLDHHPTAQVKAIEISNDFFLRNGSSDRARLEEIRDWLRKCLLPQRHPAMKGAAARRKFYDEQTGRYIRDTLNATGSNTTVVWGSRYSRSSVQVRLYIKDSDNKIPLTGQHSVRLEVTLFVGDCQKIGLNRVAELPKFVDGMRRYNSPFFHVAAGIKTKIVRSRANKPARVARAAHKKQLELDRVGRAWQHKGSAWAAKHGYAVIPDTKANRMIGIALKNLRDELLPLKLTRNVAEHPGYEVLQRSVNAELCHSLVTDSIDRSVSPLSQRLNEYKSNLRSSVNQRQ
jgi:hypothetical protein